MELVGDQLVSQKERQTNIRVVLVTAIIVIDILLLQIWRGESLINEGFTSASPDCESTIRL